MIEFNRAVPFEVVLKYAHVLTINSKVDLPLKVLDKCFAKYEIERILEVAQINRVENFMPLSPYGRLTSKRKGVSCQLS